MQKQTLVTTAAPSAIGPYSQAVRINNLLYTSGQIPLDPETMEIIGDSIIEQTRQVMENLQALIEYAGGSMSDILKTTCF